MPRLSHPNLRRRLIITLIFTATFLIASASLPVKSFSFLGIAALYINALLQKAGLPDLSIKGTLISQLQWKQITQSQALRLVVETKEVEDKFYNRGFISMMYFGFMRRDPDTMGFDNHIKNLSDPSGDYTNKVRHMVFDFIYSTEYRGRFSKP